MNAKRKWYTKPLLGLGLLLGATFAGFPILWMIANSLKPNSEIFAWPPVWISPNSSLEPYLAVFQDPAKMRFFFNSYLVSTIVVIVTLAISILAAYAFSRFDFPGKMVINALIIAIQAVPPITLLIP
ncbi:MAG: carbohydrate ABC transporter permease, partial [Clostridia bacterium]